MIYCNTNGFDNNVCYNINDIVVSKVKPPNFDFFDTLVLEQARCSSKHLDWQERSTRKPEKDMFDAKSKKAG